MKSVLELLSAAAERCPEMTALRDAGQSLSYREYLSAVQGVGALVADRLGEACSPVAVWAKHEALTPVLCLGAVWGGGFYVPIDPELPPAKLQKVLDDCAPALLLTPGGENALPEGVDFPGETVSAETALRLGKELPRPDFPLEPERPLYMVYTSGSTGAPKGVLKSHGAMLSFLSAYTEAFEFSSEEIIGSQTPFFFDASAKDLYLALRLTATVEILERELFSFPVRLIQRLNERKVTFISWVPSALAIVTQLNTFSEVKPRYLRKVFFVGEVFPMKQLNRWRAALPEVRFVNLYGASELCGVCCAYEVSGEFADGAVLPIGGPLPGSRVFLRGESGPVSAPGETGELCVSSAALAIGYYRDPEQTAAAFRTETLPDGTEGRVFHTGDLARYDEGGRLLFASRKDHQFKHMGRRIEAGEIEAAAAALPEIARCCCVYQQSRGKIVLFCQPAPGAEADRKTIRQALRQNLSDYMVPGRVVLMEALPLNANGKIDRPALAALLEDEK